MTTKRIITLCALLIPIVCSSQNIAIKLDCQMSLSKQTSDGVTKQTFNENIEVTQKGEFLLISFASGKITSLHTEKNKDVIEVMNLSDKDKWSIYRDYEKDGIKIRTSINIDRNNGSILVKEVSGYRSYNEITESQGSCKKVDTTKRLF